MFQSDHSPDLPAGIIAELGIDPATVRETIEHERAMRCPERPAVYPERRFANLVPKQPCPDPGVAKHGVQKERVRHLRASLAIGMSP